ILSSDPNPYSALEGRARAESQAATGFGRGDRNRRSRRIASPVRASVSLMKSLKMQSRRTFGEPQSNSRWLRERVRFFVYTNFLTPPTKKEQSYELEMIAYIEPADALPFVF